MDENYCPSCGEKLSGSPRFCPKCGTELNGVSPAPQSTRTRPQRSYDMDPKDRMMRLVYAIIIVFVFIFLIGGYHYLKYMMGYPI